MVFLTVIISSLVIIKLYIKFTTGWCHSRRSLEGKTAIVTGANSGIGYETAVDLVQRGARTIIACRNKEKAEAARKQIITDTGRDNVFVKILDLESFESVRQFAKEINETEERLDILVNNAGCPLGDYRRTEDGFQLPMKVNHYSPFLLTNLLLDLLKKSSPSRIINVSAMTAKRVGRIDFNNLNKIGISKLCNILFSIELAKRLEGTGVTVNCLHPGLVETEIYRNFPLVIRFLIKGLIRLFVKSAKAGAQTTIYLAVDEEVENVTGKYFEDCKLIEHYKNATYPEDAKQLWIHSEQIVKLTEKKSN